MHTIYPPWCETYRPSYYYLYNRPCEEEVKRIFVKRKCMFNGIHVVFQSEKRKVRYIRVEQIFRALLQVVHTRRTLV